ncbi:hypothetical protein [Chloracidobacterium aggregatum]|uniref:hypothetical protein n=1 Tax=Chloracidobacterium aggregatum TaxID=2851959 RepID=UPI0020180810|nr:hypothetical protein [Chloracidobacterium aggregatum]
MEILEDLQRRRIHAPLLLRFPQILVNQMKKLTGAFRSAIREFDYKGGTMACFR